MAGVVSRSFDSPDEVRTPPNTTVDVVDIGGVEVGRFTFQPGWKSYQDIKPVAGTHHCRIEHFGYVVSVRPAPHRPRGRNRAGAYARRDVPDRAGTRSRWSSATSRSSAWSSESAGVFARG